MTAPACGSCTAPVADARLCTGCTRDLAELLLLAASIAPDLDDAVARLLKRGSGGKRSADENPLPLDLAASDAKRELAACLMTWVLQAQPPPGTILIGITALARWLAANTDRLRKLINAGRAHREIRDAVHRALAVIDRPAERAPAGTCNGCGAQLLAELGADEVTCRCGALTIALQDKRRERAAAADVLGTPAELSTVLATLGYTVAPGTISGWGTRGQVQKRYNGFYLLSEALAMAAKMGTRRARIGA